MMSTPQIVHRELQLGGAARVLVAESEPWLRARMEKVLGEEGYAVESFPDGRALLDALEAERGNAVAPVLIICGLFAPGGVETLARLRERALDTSLIVVAEYGDDNAQSKADHLDASCVLFKPLELDDLRLAAMSLAEPLP